MLSSGLKTGNLCYEIHFNLFENLRLKELKHRLRLRLFFHLMLNKTFFKLNAE